MASPLSTFIQARHPQTLPAALTDFDLLGNVILTDAHLIVAGMGGYPPTIPFWPAQGQPAVSGTPLGDNTNYAYDLAVALCAGYDANNPGVVVGLLTPPPAGPIMPPTTCMPVAAMKPIILSAYNASVQATKPGSTQHSSGVDRLNTFIEALAEFIYQAYI